MSELTPLEKGIREAFVMRLKKHGLGATSIGRIIGRDHSTVSKIISRVEQEPKSITHYEAILFGSLE